MGRSKECYDVAINGPPSDFLQAISMYARTTHYRRGAAIYCAGDPADYWYLVGAGIAARSALLSDGRRQIVELLLSGNFFGSTACGVHHSTVEVVPDQTTIVRYATRNVEALAESNAKLARQIRELAFEAIRRLDDRVVTVGRMNAVEKVGAFLIEMAERAPHDPRGPDCAASFPLRDRRLPGPVDGDREPLDQRAEAAGSHLAPRAASHQGAESSGAANGVKPSKTLESA